MRRFRPGRTRRIVFFLYAPRSYELQPFPEMAWIHSRGGTDSRKITIVVKKKFLRFTAIAQRPSDPLFQSLCDNGPPKPFLCSSLILVLKNSAPKHAWSP